MTAAKPGGAEGAGVLRVLHLEDHPHDVTLIRAALDMDGIDCQIHNVATREAFVAALDAGPYDLILSDYGLPSFDGLGALAIASDRAPDVPFILVSGTIGEDAAIESLRSGATDYVLKQRLTRLGPAVRRALEEARERRERRRLEDQLRQSQKMEAIGQLAGGVSHDFNNVLTAILGYSELLRRRLPGDEAARAELGEIENAALRAAALTRQLLAFSRKQVLQPKVVAIDAVLAEMENMLRRLIGEDVEFRTLHAEDLWRVEVDPGQLQQVVLNLAVNARDSMPRGGTLFLETANLFVEIETAHGPDDLAPGRYVMVSVTDTGCGMDDATRARIFEPFFTTKGEGKGTGLGLSTVHGIVSQSGGRVEVYSEPGCGTTFRILLPAVDAAREIAATAEAPAAPPRRGTGTVLLVEDDPQVRALVADALRLHGYTVLVARHGHEALAIVERDAPALDLLLTDVVMPFLSGVELAARLRATYPELAVLCASGYTELAIQRHGVLPDMAFIQKPFTPGALLDRVADVLAAPRRRAA